MQTITKSYNVYSFDELSEDAKQKALENLCDINVDYDWWESTYDDAENVGLKIEGFDIRGYCKMRFIEDSAYTMNKILKNHGETCETYKTAKQFSDEWNALVEKYSDGIKKDIVAEENEYDFDNEAEDLADEFLRSLSEDYRIILQNEYEYLTGKEAIIETIKANEYQFTEDGKLF